MAMIQLTGTITESGELKINLPAGLPPGEVRVTIEPEVQTPTQDEIPWEDQPWTEDELRDLLKFEPKTGAEIAASEWIGAWADHGITDSVAWVEETRRKERERRNLEW